MSPRVARLGRLLAGSALLTGTTGTTGAAGVAHAAQAAAHPQAKVTYTVGVSVPFNELKELATGIDHAVRVAVAQANKRNLVPGVTFQVKSLDDTVNGKHDGAKDAQNGLQFVNDSTVIGSVGPLNSSADVVSEPVYNRNGLVQISPSNTNPDLTARIYRAKYEPASLSGSPLTYFRTCTTDSYQGPAAALYAKKAGYKAVFVTDNQGAYGIGLANAFKAEAIKIGLKVVGSAELDAANVAPSAQQLATSIAAKKPDLVYFGGEYGAKGGAEIFDDSLHKAGLTKFTFMGGDGIYASDFIKSAYEDNGLATSVGGDPTKDPNAQAFIKAEAAQYPGTTPQAYDTYSYDAAGVIINAFAKAVKAGKIKVGASMTKTNRLLVAQYVGLTSDYHGATGPVSFDRNGDSNNHLIGVYKVTGTGSTAKWAFLKLAPKV